MKFSIALIFSLSLSLFAFGQKSSNYPLGKEIDYHYGYNSDHSTDSAIYTYTYDTLHREVFDEVYHLVNGNKINYSITNFTYDSGGLFANCEISNYNNTLKQFVKSEGIYTKYDASGHILYSNSGNFKGNTLVLQVFSNYKYDSSGKKVSGATMDTLKHSGEEHLYCYNSLGSMIADTQFFWYTKKNIWARESLTCRIKNKLNQDSIYTTQPWDGVKFYNMSGQEYFYDSLNKLCKTVSIKGSDTLWINEFSDSTKYNSSGWITYEDEWNPDSSKWLIRNREIFKGNKYNYCYNTYFWDSASGKYSTMIDIPDLCDEYDSNGHIILVNSSNNWGDMNFYQAKWTYDSAKRLTFYHQFDNYDIYEDTYYYYPMYTSIEKQTNTKDLFHLFPNPSSGNYTLSFPENFSGELIVYDITGAIKMNQNISGQNKISFDLKEPAGMYFLRVIEKNTNNVYTQKLIKY